MLLDVARRSLRQSSFRSSLSSAFRISSSSSAPVDLSFEKFDSPSEEGNDNGRYGPLVICHGLFGSKQNWRGLSKTLARSLKSPVYALDLRNHGTSPHSSQMDYATMAADVLHFFTTHSLERVSLLGHSMGGKVVMAAALSPDLPEGAVSRLIVADMTPAIGPISPEFRSYVDAMLEIERRGVRSKREADAILQEVEKSESVRQFLLTNLVASSSNPAHFRVPLSIIRGSIDGIGSFPYTPGERTWEGKTLFVKGAESKYINKNNIPIAERFFPNMRLEMIDAGHWVHAEQPHEFVRMVTEFIKED